MLRRTKNKRTPLQHKPSLQKFANSRKQYDTYIHSREWEIMRRSYFQRHLKICAACNSPNNVHLHHMVYGEYGHEPDEHLIPLCDVHHKMYHRRFGTQRDMIRTTLAYVMEIRRILTTPALLA